MIITEFNDFEKLNKNRVYRYSCRYGNGVLHFGEDKYYGDERWYSCHNFKKDGSESKNTHGYKYSWAFSSDKDIFSDLIVKTKCIEL